MGDWSTSIHVAYSGICFTVELEAMCLHCSVSVCLGMCKGVDHRSFARPSHLVKHEYGKGANVNVCDRVVFF